MILISLPCQECCTATSALFFSMAKTGYDSVNSACVGPYLKLETLTVIKKLYKYTYYLHVILITVSFSSVFYAVSIQCEKCYIISSKYFDVSRYVSNFKKLNQNSLIFFISIVQ